MKEKIINDLDHFATMQAIKKKDLKWLKDFTKHLNSEGFICGELVSDLEKYNKKERIKFPFEILKKLNKREDENV